MNKELKFYLYVFRAEVIWEVYKFSSSHNERKERVSAMDQLRELLATNVLTDSVDSFHLLSTFAAFNMWSTISKAGRGALFCVYYLEMSTSIEKFFLHQR